MQQDKIFEVLYNENKSDELISEYLNQQKNEMLKLKKDEVRNILISEYNYQLRKQWKSCRPIGLTISSGDICYLDYGKAYLSEAGFQHFGLVLSVFNSKAFIIPMTSNVEAYHSAYDEYINPDGLTHLMRIGKQQGCNKYSVLFLNDAKFINTARIINIKGHINTDSLLYKKIKNRMIEIIQTGK